MVQTSLANTMPARADCSRRWHNSLPAWIVQCAGYPRLGQSFRQTLQAIADACDPPKPHGDGSLTVAFGGKLLYAAAGCSGRTFWRHVKRLIGCGYVVQLGRGGVIGSTSYGNVYAIPGRRGGLDARRCQPRMMRMVRCDDGRYRPEVIEPGVQATLWGTQEARDNLSVPAAPVDNSVDNLSDSCEQLASYSQPPCHSVTGGTDSLSHPPCQSVTPPYPHETPYEKNHGGLTETRQPTSYPQSHEARPGAATNGGGRPGRPTAADSHCEARRAAPAGLLPSNGVPGPHRPRVAPAARKGAGEENNTNNGAGRAKPQQQRRRRSGRTHVDPDDLASTPHLLNLFQAYCDKGIVGNSPDDRLQFFGMAEHVLSYRDGDGRPAADPAAMFASNVRKGRWLWVTENHRQAAQRRLREFLHG